MIKLTFHLPTHPQTQKKLALFAQAILQARNTIEDAITHNRPLHVPEDMETCVWEDLKTVVAGLRMPPESMYQDWTMWSLHRETPRWGTPLFSISANELDDSVTLVLWTSRGWADFDEFREYIEFECVEPLSSLKAKWSAIEDTQGLDYWVVLGDECLVAVFRDATTY